MVQEDQVRRGSGRRLRAMDLFCGAGGLTLGLKQSGFDVVAAVELDSLACSTYRANHPEVRLYERDLRRLTGKQVLRDLKLNVGQLDSGRVSPLSGLLLDADPERRA